MKVIGKLIITIVAVAGLAGCAYFKHSNKTSQEGMVGHHDVYADQEQSARPIHMPRNVQRTARVREYYPIPEVVHNNMGKPADQTGGED